MKQLLSFALVVCAFPALADKTVAVAPADVTTVDTLDEVVVQGDRDSLSAAKVALVAAEDRFYARYNKLNRDDRYDIGCHLEAPRDHHSRITTRVCEPRFVDESPENDAARMQGYNGIYTTPSVDARKEALKLELRKKTLQLIRDDPELLRALLERARLAEHYEALRKKKLRDRHIVWD